MYKKSFIKDFSFPEGLIFEDLPFFAQCWLNAEKISYDLEPLYFYRKSSSSIMSDACKNFIDIFEINKIISKIFEASGKFEKYRTILLVSQMESSLVRTLKPLVVQKEKCSICFKKHTGISIFPNTI